MEIITVSNPSELDECLRIRLEVFVREQHVPADEEIDSFDASYDACRHILLRNGGTAVATGRWRKYEDKAAKLQRIAVLSAYRGGGFGKAVIDALENDAKAAGMEYAVLDAQCQAEAFYRKLGYETVSEKPFLDAGIWHVRMKKPL
ncbi:GNAT family N-acetyltransferase [Paenibacillus contaminans]|jgi:predicted GNAT family N-acyltransferase|uniref:GNAT family N-acetyltransferase n=1 Tax=Paenibacillus contaminans TaxID=450362 RepID=A0A329MJ62_9BACL|nr:GNAT family N-acetyltransferase [Paenibacillus contaminans]RAV19855.1 GNAT family N-acetyltransferase [Paenibacillus contaminans]